VTDPSIYNRLSMAELDKIWDQVQSHIIPYTGPNPKNCIVTDYSPASNGRPQVTHKGCKYYISIVLCLRRYRIKDPKYNIPVGHECSHICNNPPCINADWLCFETGPVNRSRNCCDLFKNVNGYLCPHEDPICYGCTGIVRQNVDVDDDDGDDVDDEDIDMYDDNGNIDIFKLFGINITFIKKTHGCYTETYIIKKNKN